ncbi:MAG: tandem-95 repeat protein, partial [Planctomycetaceae bacterium]
AGDAVDAYRINTLPANGTLSLNGVAVARNAMVTQAQIDSGALTFRPNTNWNGSTSFSFSAYDGQAYSTSAATFGLTVNPVNDAPIATAGSASLNEDATRVITLAGTDPDAGDAIDSYRIETLPANGTLLLNGTAISAGASVTRAQISSNALTFRPDTNWNGSTNFTFSAYDGDVYSAAPATFSLTVNPVNDAPTSSAGSLTLNEDTTGVVTLSGADIDAGDAVDAYRINTLPANGTLLLNGTAIGANATVTQAQIDSGALTFRPNTNWNGSTSFTFRAYDGQAYSATAATFSLTVNPVNDAPTATAGSLIMNEDGTGVVTLAGADIDAGDAIESYRIDTLPSDGTLLLNGQAVSSGAIVTQAEINSGSLSFQPAANWNGSTSFTFSTNDGDAWSAAPASFDLTVNAVNDAPTAIAGGIGLDEDSTAIITLAGTDIDSGDAIESYRIDSLPEHGSLLLNGQEVHAGDVVTQAQIDGGELVFKPEENWNGSTTFAFSTSDGESWSASTAAFDLTVNPVNDAPLATPGSMSLDEDTTGVVTLAGSDVDGGDVVESYRIDTLPANGTLLLNGQALAAGATVTQAQIDAGALVFKPANDFQGSTSFTFSTSDGESWSTSAAAMDITVNDVAEPQFDIKDSSEFRPQWDENEDLRVLDPNTYDFGGGEPLQTLDKVEGLLQQQETDDGGNVLVPSDVVIDSSQVTPMLGPDQFNETGPVILSPVTELDAHGNAVPVEIVYALSFDHDNRGTADDGAVQGSDPVSAPDAPAVGMLWGLLRGFAGTRDTVATAGGEPSHDRKSARR